LSAASRDDALVDGGLVAVAISRAAVSALVTIILVTGARVHQRRPSVTQRLVQLCEHTPNEVMRQTIETNVGDSISNLHVLLMLTVTFAVLQRHLHWRTILRTIPLVKKGKGSLDSITERRVPELIPVVGSQPADDVSYKPGGRLPLLSARPAVTLATLTRTATNFAAW